MLGWARSNFWLTLSCSPRSKSDTPTVTSSLKTSFRMESKSEMKFLLRLTFARSVFKNSSLNVPRLTLLEARICTLQHDIQSAYLWFDASMNITKNGLFASACARSSLCILKLHFFPCPNFNRPVDCSYPTHDILIMAVPSMIRVGKSRKRMAIAGFTMLK